MCGIRSSRATAAFTSAEMLVAAGLASLVGLAVAVFSFYTTRALVATVNYVDLDQQGQLALDQFTQQVRGVNQLTSYTTSYGVINSLTFQDYDGDDLTFSYDPNVRTLSRTKGGNTDQWLTNCDSLQFQIYQRNVQSNTFDCVSTGNATNCKLIQVTWVCSRTILGSKANTESVQSAKVVMRQQQQ